MYIVAWPEKGIFKAWILIDTFTKTGRVSFGVHNKTRSFMLKLDRDFVENYSDAQKIVKKALQERKIYAERRLTKLDAIIAGGVKLKTLDQYSQ